MGILLDVQVAERVRSEEERNGGDLSYDEKCIARVTAFHNEFATLASGFEPTHQTESCANIDCVSIVLRFGIMVRC